MVLEERDEAVWYVQAQGRVWGPYSEARVAAFVDEGRIAVATLIANDPKGPFLPAGEGQALGHLFQAQPPTTSAPRAYAPASPPLGRRYEPSAEPAGGSRPVLVFANLGTLEEAAFEAALAIHGPFERVGRGLWLVQVRLGAPALRNALSRRLRGDDTLLVVEAGLDQVAWFNLGQAEERRLRELWLG